MALTAVLGAAGHLIAVTLLGLGLGAVIRHSAGAIAAVTGMVLLLPLALGQFPPPWNVRLERLMPYLSPPGRQVPRRPAGGAPNPGRTGPPGPSRAG